MTFTIERFKLIHARLDAEIRRELKARWPRAERIMRLKKLRLAVKDRLHETARRLSSVG